MSYPVIRYAGSPAHIRKASTPGFVVIWPGAAPARTGPPARSLDRVTVSQARRAWPAAIQALYPAGDHQ